MVKEWGGGRGRRETWLEPTRRLRVRAEARWGLGGCGNTELFFPVSYKAICRFGAEVACDPLGFSKGPSSFWVEPGLQG